MERSKRWIALKTDGERLLAQIDEWLSHRANRQVTRTREHMGYEGVEILREKPASILRAMASRDEAGSGEWDAEQMAFNEGRINQAREKFQQVPGAI